MNPPTLTHVDPQTLRAFAAVLLLPFLLLLCCYDELVVIPQQLAALRQKSDSVSRFIYSGTGRDSGSSAAGAYSESAG